MKDLVIKLENLEFSYAKGRSILKVKNFEVKKGEKIFVFGPSGSGKSTLLSLLTGINLASGGKVEVFGTDMAKISGRKRDELRGSHCGYIFQMFNLIPYLSAYDNIILSCRLNKTRMQRIEGDIEASVLSLAKSLGVDKFLHKSVSELSIGQQQRVAAARAFLGAPPLIIADEPTSSLDTDSREDFITTLFEIAERNDTTIVFVSHDRGLKKYFDRSISLLEINEVGAKI